MGMYISSQSSCDFTTVAINGEPEERRTTEGIFRNYYDREDGETTPRFEVKKREKLQQKREGKFEDNRFATTEGITRRIDYSLIRLRNQRCRVLYKVEDITTYLVEYVKFWDDWEVDRYGNANLDYDSEDQYAVSINKKRAIRMPPLSKDHKRKEDQYGLIQKTQYTQSRYGSNIIFWEDIKRWSLLQAIPIRPVDDNLRSVEAEFPAIVINDAITPQDALQCKSQVSTPINDEIEFRISFDESDDESSHCLQ
ncbi:hypothetical protein Tco_0532559 [Tanacetum coccineum]